MNLTRVHSLILLTPLLFSSNMLAARAVHGEIPPVTLAFGRWVFAFLFSLALLKPAAWPTWKRLLREAPWLLVLGGLGMAFCGPAVYMGARTTTALNIGLIYAATPAFIALLARILYREPIRFTQTTGILASGAGLLFILCQGDPAGALAGLRFTIGDLWILASTASWALYSVFLRFAPTRLAPETRFSFSCLAGLLLLLPFLALERDAGWATAAVPKTWLLFAFLGLVPSLLAYRCYGRLQSGLGASTAGFIMYLVPICNSGLAILLLGESFHAYHAIGGALALLGIWFSTLRRFNLPRFPLTAPRIQPRKADP